MIKTFNINLAGQIFNINEDAYEHLSQYFNSLRTFYANEEDKDEIIRDIEARFAELFLAKGKNYIITKQDAEEVVNLMGNPQEFDEENHQASSSTTNNYTTASSNTKFSGKRLYRDMDNSIVAGVCSGISNYLGINDPIWLRITFILLTFFTVGFWMFAIYPILWFIIPEAITSAQKLEMKGEAINLSNIEKKIKDDTFMEKPKGIFNQIIAFLGAGTLIFFKILLWFAIGIAIFMSGAIILSLIVMLIVLAIVTVIGIPFANAFYFNNSSDGWFLGIGGLLVGIIPIIMLIVGLVHLISKKSKPFTKKFVFPMIGLFLFGFLLLNISSYHARQLVSEKKKINQTFPLSSLYKSDTLQITVNPSIKDENYSDININGITGLVNLISEQRNNIIPVKIEILQSATDSFYIIKEYSASGKNNKDAILNASLIKHNINQINNKVIIDPYIQFENENENVKFRNQKLHIRVYVPEGKVIKWDKRTEEYMDMDNIAINWDDVRYPMSPLPPLPPMSKKQNHQIEIKTSKNGDSAASKIVINIDSDNEDINDALDKAQEKIDEAREKIDDAETIDISNIDEEDNRLYRQHYIFKMVNGELVPID